MNRREILLSAAALSACGPAESQAPPPAPFPMRRGVNLGNALEAPNEGDWGYRIEDAHLAAIADAGFDGVRLPVRWEPHMAATAPHAIATGFLDRVEAIVTQALDRHLIVQLDAHHYQDLLEHPEREQARFAMLWRQIAQHFRGAPPTLLFEPLNEPNGPVWTAPRVSAVENVALAEIRTASTDRLVVFGGPNWNSIDGLVGWTPPADAKSAVTVHYYEPHAFTHQHAEWLGADAPHFDRDWGTPEDLHAVEAHAARAARWAAAHGLALQLGEFGANARVPLDQRARWTRTVRQAFENVGAGWCVWDFAGAFPIWDRQTRRFIPEMLDALID